jgi:NAD+ synthase (glutamine-hydrolysing)
MKGYFLPLSGGADSAATCAMVGIMCKIVIKEIQNKNEQVILDTMRLTETKRENLPKDYKELCKKIFYTCYMGTKHSSTETRDRAKKISDEVGSTHMYIEIDDVTQSILEVFEKNIHKTPKFKV